MTSATSAQAKQSTGVLPQLLNVADPADLADMIASPDWWMQEKHDGDRRILRKRGDVV